jgi:hypothetical protein
MNQLTQLVLRDPHTTTGMEFQAEALQIDAAFAEDDLRAWEL